MFEADIRAMRRATGMCLQLGAKGFRCTVTGPHSVHRSTDSDSGEVFDEWPVNRRGVSAV